MNNLIYIGAHLDSFEERVQIGDELVPHRIEVRSSCQLQLMPESPLAEELHPVVHPSVGLRRAPYGVVDGKPESAASCIRILHPQLQPPISHVVLMY